MKHIDTDILIAGGGVAGLTATVAFAAEGFDVVCVHPAPPVTSAEADGSDLRSTAFLSPSIDLLRRAGLWDRLEPHSAPLRIMRLADAGGPEQTIRETADFIAEELGEPAFGYNLPNWLLRREIAARIDAIPNARLIAPARLDRVTPRTSTAIAALSDGTTVRAPLVIAADGRDSPTRQAAGIAARRWSYGQKAVVFTVTHTLTHDGVSTEIHRTGGPFTLVPLPDRDGDLHSAVVWMETGPRASDLATMDIPDFEAALNARSCGVLGRLSLASGRRIWPIVSQVVDRLDGPRLALIAEAAHVIPPIGAQGLNMSLRDVATLRDLCIAARDSGRDIGAPDLLARYSRTRHPDILARVLGVDALNRSAMTQARPLRDIRRVGLKTLHGLKPLRLTAMRLGLGVRFSGDVPRGT